MEGGTVTVTKTCAGCGRSFEAGNARRRTCSDRCRKSASRKSRIAPVGEPADPIVSAETAPGRLWRATFAELTAADRVDTPLGQLALEHAAALDNPQRGDTGSARAALSKEYRAALAEAMKDAETESDELDDILESANVKAISGGGR